MASCTTQGTKNHVGIQYGLYGVHCSGDFDTQPRSSIRHEMDDFGDSSQVLRGQWSSTLQTCRALRLTEEIADLASQVRVRNCEDVLFQLCLRMTG